MSDYRSGVCNGEPASGMLAGWRLPGELRLLAPGCNGYPAPPCDSTHSPAQPLRRTRVAHIFTPTCTPPGRGGLERALDGALQVLRVGGHCGGQGEPARDVRALARSHQHPGVPVNRKTVLCGLTPTNDICVKLKLTIAAPVIRGDSGLRTDHCNQQSRQPETDHLPCFALMKQQHRWLFGTK